MNLSSETAQSSLHIIWPESLFEEDKQTPLPRRNNDANLSLPVLIDIAVCISVEKEIEK